MPWCWAGVVLSVGFLLVSAAIGKTGAQNRHDAARIAREQGWV